MIQGKKYLIPNAHFPHPHIGNMVVAVLKQQGKNKTDLSKMLGVSRTSLAQYLGKASFQFSILWNIGIALNHDFFTELCNHYPSAMPRNQKSVLVKENLELKVKLEEVEKTCSIYEKIAMK